MNSQVYNFYSDPLYVIGTNSNAFQSINGNFYSITASGLSVSIGGNTLIQLTNPSGTNKTLYLYKFILSTSGASTGLTITFIRNGTFPAPGTTLTPANTNFSSPLTSVATAKYGSGSPVGTTPILITVQSSQIYTEFIDSVIVMPPNTSLVIQISNTLLSIQTIAFSLFWYEV